jgi:hypothetical protein
LEIAISAAREVVQSLVQKRTSSVEAEKERIQDPHFAGQSGSDSADGSTQSDTSPDADEDDDSEEDKLPIRTCSATAAELVTCVLRNGGWPGACSDSRFRACLMRTGHARPGERATLVPSRHGLASAVHADVFESLALMMYGEWMEWGLGVLDRSFQSRR